jgi:hypothetical protein
VEGSGGGFSLATRREGSVCARSVKLQIKKIALSQTKRNGTETKDEPAMPLEQLVRDIDLLEVTHMFYSLRAKRLDVELALLV